MKYSNYQQYSKLFTILLFIQFKKKQYEHLLKENTTLQNKVEKLQNDYDTVCSQLRQKEMHLEDLKVNLSEFVSIII